VVTACPRVAIDDYLKFETPVLTLTELDLALTGQGEYTFDEIRSKDYRPIYVG
jgi:diphthamide synthase subunit DPH2